MGIGSQGTWLNNTATPLERPKEAAGRTSFTVRKRATTSSAINWTGPRADALTIRASELDVAGDLDLQSGRALPGNRTSIIHRTRRRPRFRRSRRRRRSG